MVGFGEQEDPGFDAMYLYFNGSQLVYARAPGGNLGCATSAPVVQVPATIPFQTEISISLPIGAFLPNSLSVKKSILLFVKVDFLQSFSSL
jgi:hypothetical protein